VIYKGIEKVKILIIDPQNYNLLDFALSCIAIGHDITYYIDSTDRNNLTGSGLLEMSSSWEDKIEGKDLILFATNNYKDELVDKLIEDNYPIIGTGSLGGKLESDREFGIEILKQYNIFNTIPCKKFNTKYECEQYIVDNSDQRFVFKPPGETIDKSMTYVSRNNNDLLFMLNHWDKLGKLPPQFYLQKFIKGIEMAVGGWFSYKSGFSRYVFENFEFKKLMNDDLGVATYEQGTVGRYILGVKSKLAQEVLFKIESYLKKIKYVGYIDVNCIIDGEGIPYPLEFTTRFGYPTFALQSSLHKGDPAQFLLDLTQGKDTLRVDESVATCVVLSQPDYPYDKIPVEQQVGIPILGITKENRKFIKLFLAMQTKVPEIIDGKIQYVNEFATTGGFIMCCIGIGGSIQESQDRVYKLVKSIEIPNSLMYRTDIGDRLEYQIPILHSLGYFNDIEYGVNFKYKQEDVNQKTSDNQRSIARSTLDYLYKLDV